MNSITTFIQANVPITAESIDKLSSCCSDRVCEKGETLINTGSYCNHLFFINQGVVKLSFEADDGEFIMRFFQENILFTELESLTTGKPSKYQIVALEDLNYSVIPYPDFEQLCREDSNIALFYRTFLTRAHINMMNRISEMLESDAKTRYNNFIQLNGELINRIKLGDLSRYLGINQVTLSRIRRQD